MLSTRIVILHQLELAQLLQNPDSEMAQKQAEQDRLRKAEKFMKIGTGQAECTACGYAYDPKKGDSEYPVSPGTKFEVCKSKCKMECSCIVCITLLVPCPAHFQYTTDPTCCKTIALT